MQFAKVGDNVNILVSGGTTFVSKYISEYFRDLNFNVYIFNRGNNLQPEGVKFINMAIQRFRNEKVHTPAKPLDKNLAIHYISLASLAYELISRN